MNILYFILILFYITYSSSFILHQPYKFPITKLSKSNIKLSLSNNSYHNTNYTLEKGYNSSTFPIKKISIDDALKQLINIKIIYLSSKNDRIIIEYFNKNKFVIYISNDYDNRLINVIINSSKKAKKIIISDTYNTMDNMFGYLFCEKND